MADLKKTWKQTAKSFVLAFSDLGVSVFETAKAGYDAAVDWAKKDNPHYVHTQGEEVYADQAPEAEAAEAKEEPAAEE